MVRELVEKCGAFDHFLDFDGHLYVFNEIADLTGFCVPSLRTIQGVFRVDYDYGMAVPMKTTDRKAGFVQSLREWRSVVLPRTIRPSHSMYMLIHGDELSHWLANDMVEMMRRFTLHRNMALQLIKKSDDRYLNALKRVYRDKFSDRIVQPLINQAP